MQLINLHPKYIDLSLNRLKVLLKKLNNPHLNVPPIIHIAGTNGKGSILSYLRHILIESNLTVHTYTSPHLSLFNERIILNNKEVRTNQLLKTLKLVKKINAGKPITFFEITTAAAFYLFSKEKADFLILETGLGGRLDATNIIKKSLIDIITPIGLDHQEFSGDNILKIADEKLGIIKNNNKNIIISKQKKIVLSHIKKKFIQNKKNVLYFNKNFKIINKNKKNFILKFENKKNKFNNPALLGTHQLENASTAIATIFRLNQIGYKFTIQNINNGIAKTKWPGRLEVGKLKNIKVYLDGAHNLDGASQLLNFFKDKKIKVWMIIGMLNNKDIYGYLKKIKPIIKGVVPILIPGEKNSFKPEEIGIYCDKLGLKHFPKASILKANNFLSNQIKAEVILVSGSLYLIGKIRKKYL